ncbi:HAMP domain-containing protein, partial [Klebsiella pneumoniae]
LIVSLPFLVLPAWWSVRLALRPWMRLQAQVAARGPQDLQPLVPEAPHRELRPLVDAINALLERLRASQQRERQLIADAAHELRTPLTAM